MSTPKTETKIWLAIKSRIDTLLPGYAKAWPYQTFTPPSQSGKLLPYLRIGRVSATPARQFVADGKPYLRTGFIVITLVHPLGQKQSYYDELAGTISEHFSDSTDMRYQDICVSVNSDPHITEGFEENGYIQIPVRIPWQTFV